MKIRPLNDIKADLGEGPVWDEKNQTIYWLDILNGLIHEYEFETGRGQHFSVGEMIGSYALTDKGNMIIASKSGFGYIDKINGTYKLLAAPEKHLPNNRFNDGKCDPKGRFWAGSMSLIGEKEVGTLYKFENSIAVPMIKGVSISNGLAWSLDSKIMYYIDTPTRQVVGYDFDMEQGQISNKRVIITLDEGSGYPDGMTIDAEGMLWIAHWDGWRISRWDPSSGNLLMEIKMPASQITSLTFGGPNLDKIFVTSAKTGLDNKTLESQPLAGSIFEIADLGIKGLIGARFSD